MVKKIFMVAVLAAMAAGVLTWGPRASGADAAAVIAQAQALSDQEKFEDANKLLLDLAKQEPNNPDVYWKIAENYYDIGERIDIAKDKAKKLDMYKQCEAWAKKGYDKNPGLADNAFWMAVGMSQQAQTNGIAVTLLSDRTLAKRIEDFYVKSSQAKEYHYRTPTADTISSAYFALGQFYRKVPDSFIVKLLMGTKGDINLSVENCQKAVQMYPKNIEYNKELGVSYLCRGGKDDNDADIAEGKKWLQKAVALPAENALDRIDQADSKRLMADPSLACGYGRVQQEEVSEDAFKNK